MTRVIVEQLKSLEQLLLFSSVFKKGLLKVNISKLARQFQKDRKTIRNYLNGKTPKKTRNKAKYLDRYHHLIKTVLTDKYQSFDYINHLFNYLKREHHITCSRSTLNRYIRKDEELNDLFKRKNTTDFTERFETKPGFQAQFDIKEKVKLIKNTGEVVVVYIPTLTLSWSRHNNRMLSLDVKLETLLFFLAKSFEELGGVPGQLVIDNLRQFVDKPRSKRESAVLTSKFMEFCKDYNIEAFPCMPYRPQTKGKTETQNKIVEQLKNYNGTYLDITDMHDMLQVINNEDNLALSQATKFPRIVLLEKERGDLQPLPSKEVRQKYHLRLQEVYVSNESLISFKSNKYSVPKRFIGLKVGVVVVRDELHLYYNNKIITVHQISNQLLNIKKEHQLMYAPSVLTQTEDAINPHLLNEMRNINYD